MEGQNNHGYDIPEDMTYYDRINNAGWSTARDQQFAYPHQPQDQYACYQSNPLSCELFDLFQQQSYPPVSFANSYAPQYQHSKPSDIFGHNAHSVDTSLPSSQEQASSTLMEVHTSNTTPRPVGRPRISDEEWESHEGLISRLYRTENRTLRSVMHAVKEQNGFSASESAYVNRLKQWGLKKNLKTSETAFAVAKGKQRARDEGKEAAFFFVEPEVRRERIEKYTRKFPISLTDPVSPRPCTPMNIIYHTPRAQSPGHFLERDEETSEILLSGDNKNLGFASTLFPQDAIGLSTHRDNSDQGRAELPATLVQDTHQLGEYDNKEIGLICSGSEAMSVPDEHLEFDQDLEEQEGMVVKGIPASRGIAHKHSCSSCSKVFVRASDLKKHYRMHNRPFKCDYPGCTNSQGFALLKDLRRHKNNIHLRTRFFCHYPSCPKTFSRADNCLRHFKGAHAPAAPHPDPTPTLLGENMYIQREHEGATMEGEQGRRPVLFEFGMETERNDDTTDQAGWGSESTWSLSADSLHENVKDQQGGDVKDDVPFTDSGYKSALNLEHSLNVQPDLEKSPDPPDVDSSSARADGDDNDAKTLYSLGTTVNPGHARNYIMELAKDIHSNLHRAVGAKDLTVLSNVLPQLLKAFAIKLCHDAPTRVNRRIMHFIHKRHQEVITQLEVMFDHEEDDEPDRTQGHRGDMSVLDKMRMWMSKAGQDHTVHSKEKFFVGVRDDEEDSIDQSELSAYHNIIVESPAYQWLLTNMAKESNLQLGTPQPRIRQRILDKLPTGTISKRRSPDIHEVTFELRWEDAMEEYFRYELPEQRRLSNRSFQSFVVLTGSPREAQGLTLEQYLAQTWPTAGLQLLFSLHAAVINHSHLHTVDLPGNTRLSTRILHSRLIVTSTGPAYYVADCGEILAWIWSALLGNIRNLTGFCLPLMTSFRIDAAPSNSTLQKYRGYCNFGFELTQREISDESLPGIQNFSRDLLGENAIILGFPIRRRPEGYPGLELSFDTLLLYLEAPKAEIFVLDVFIKGPRRMLKLIKHTEDVFLWRLDHSLADYSSCCTDHLSKALSCKDYSYLDHHALEAGRHILSKCADDAAPPKDPHRISEGRGLVNSKTTQTRSVTVTNSADGPEFPSHNPNAPGKMGGLRAAAESRNDETAFSTPSIQSVHSVSVLKNDPQTPHSEESERWGLLSQGSNMFSADSQLSPTTESLDDSLDSDMFSISESSDEVELLDPRETVYPLLKNILHELLTGFRTVTQYQISPGQGGDNSGPVASTTKSSHSGASSRPSQKRNLLPDEEDNDDEDGSHLPPPKRIKLSHGKNLQKYFACPFLKWGPTKYSSCCVNVKKLSSISYVKQHLIRKHTPERYCQVCQVANFPDDDSLERHINTGKCTHRDRTMLDGISYQQRSRLSRKSTPNASKEDQWFAIWDILFAGHPRPNTVYMDTDLTREMLQLHEYFTTRGPAVIRERLESDPAWRGFGITEEQSGMYLERLIAQGFNTWFEDWLSNGPSASICPQPLESSSSSNAQQSQYETPTNSIVDSGVVMGHLSSREAGAQGREILPVFRTSATGFASQPLADDTQARSPTPPVPDDATASPQTHLQIPPSASFSSAMGVQQNPEDSNNGFETEPLDDFDFDKFLAYEDMPAYLP